MVSWLSAVAVTLMLMGARQSHYLLMLAGPAHLQRPYRSFHDEVLAWNDKWLKGIETGIMEMAARYANTETLEFVIRYDYLMATKMG